MTDQESGWNRRTWARKKLVRATHLMCANVSAQPCAHSTGTFAPVIRPPLYDTAVGFGFLMRTYVVLDVDPDSMVAEDAQTESVEIAGSCRIFTTSPSFMVIGSPSAVVPEVSLTLGCHIPSSNETVGAGGSSASAGDDPTPTPSPSTKVSPSMSARSCRRMCLNGRGAGEA